MKTLTIEIPKNMTMKEVKEILAKNGIGVKPIIEKKKETLAHKTNDMTFEEQEAFYVKKLQSVDKSKTVKRATIMKNLKR